MYTNIAQIKEANRDAGFYFFEPATMRFFRSKVFSSVVPTEKGAYFITFEASRMSLKEEGYTIRFIDGKARIRTVGNFMEYKNAPMALANARELAGK